MEASRPIRNLFLVELSIAALVAGPDLSAQAKSNSACGIPIEVPGRLWCFESRSYFDPLAAGVREAHVSALALGLAKRMDFMVDDRTWRRVWDVDLERRSPCSDGNRDSALPTELLQAHGVSDSGCRSIFT